MRKGITVLTVLALAGAWAGPASAAQQSLAGQNALLKNPKPDPGGDATKRSVKGFLKENASPNTIVGNPTLGLGARLKIKTATGEQCYNLPASGWSPVSTLGYKYKDSTTVNGAINTAQIKKTGSGVFQLKVGGKAKTQPITILPPTATLSFNLAIANGDEYCGAFGSPITDDTKQSKFATSADPGGCAATSCFFCGDGVVTGTETCDTGAGNPDTALCDGGDCTAPACGDGYFNATVEFCDTGLDTPVCDAGDCSAVTCGDGYFNATAEFCDTGLDTPVCDAGDCSAVTCGDLYINSAALEVCEPPGSAFPSGNGLCDACLSPSGAFLE